MRYRNIGDIEVSPMGLGCWAIGGPFWRVDAPDRRPLGWGNVTDNESIQAICKAVEVGVNFFDTADAYGCGHSERILGKALGGRREEVVLATKFGGVFNEKTKEWLGHVHPDGIVTEKFVRRALKASLQRLNTDYIDLYQFHWGDYDPRLAADLVPVLEDLVAEGVIRFYGWSTTDPERAQVFAEGKTCAAIQYHYNIFERNPEMLIFCEEHNVTSIARGPLAMGLLTGKYTCESTIPEDDVRQWWNLQHGRQKNQLEMLEVLRAILTRDGRTLSQAALGWLWAHGPGIIPIPGFKTAKQVEENAGALEFGPLSDRQMREIDQVLDEYVGFENLTSQ